MGPVATAYTAATLLMFSVCALAGKLSPDAARVARAAATVALLTGMSRVVETFVDPPWSWVHFPAQDLLMFALCLDWFMVRGEKWALGLAACFLVQLAMHAHFWTSGDFANGHAYALQNNIVFIIELSILSVAGGRHVAAWVSRRLPLLFGGSGHRLAQMEAAS